MNSCVNVKELSFPLSAVMDVYGLMCKRERVKSLVFSFCSDGCV